MGLPLFRLALSSPVALSWPFATCMTSTLSLAAAGLPVVVTEKALGCELLTVSDLNSLASLSLPNAVCKSERENFNAP